MTLRDEVVTLSTIVPSRRVGALSQTTFAQTFRARFKFYRSDRSRWNRLSFHVFGNAGRLRNHDSVGLETLDVKADCVANFGLDRCNRFPRRDAAGQVRN